MKIYCCGCKQVVAPRLTSGEEIYPHRAGLQDLPFWKCDKCGNFVGCHHKTKNRTTPLGCIPTPALREARKHIHKILDPIWKTGRMTRVEVYTMLSKRVGWDFHTANLRTIEEARAVYSFLKGLAQ